MIAKFIKENPDHPKTPSLKSRIVRIVTAGNDVKAKPKVETLTKSKLQKQIKRDVRRDGVNDKNKETAQVLTHLFNNDKNKNEAYIQIINKSKCNLILKIAGLNNYYNLDVAAKSQNYVLVKKGNYLLTTKICDAKYSSAKKIYNDLSISLNAR